MKATGIISTTILSLLLGIAGPAHAQDDRQSHDQQESPVKQQHSQPQKQERQDQSEQQHAQQQQRHDQNARQQQARPQRQDQSNRQQHAPQPRQDHNNRQERAQQQRGNDRGQRSAERQRVEQSSWQEHRSRNWDSDHRNWQQRGGYHGYRVPDDRYRGYFGPNHGFRIGGLPFLVVGGYPRFQYEGYWISTVDPWPEYWGDNWYDNDDVYVAYVDNGYYMYNPRYPGSGVAISISF